MDTLAEIQERHDAVRDLEKKLLDLQQVNLDPIHQKLSRILIIDSSLLCFRLGVSRYGRAGGCTGRDVRQHREYGNNLFSTCLNPWA